MKRIIAIVIISSSLIFSCSNSSMKNEQERFEPIINNPILPKLVSNNLEKTNLSEIEVNAGEEFVIILDGNPKTGYQWSTDNTDEKVLTFISSKYEPSPTDPQSEGYYIWTFKAVTTGNYNLTMKYSKINEKDKDKDIVKKQIFSITIKEPVVSSDNQLNLLGDLKKKIGL